MLIVVVMCSNGFYIYFLLKIYAANTELTANIPRNAPLKNQLHGLFGIYFLYQPHNFLNLRCYRSTKYIYRLIRSFRFFDKPQKNFFGEKISHII